MAKKKSFTLDLDELIPLDLSSGVMHEQFALKDGIAERITRALMDAIRVCAGRKMLDDSEPISPAIILKETLKNLAPENLNELVFTAFSIGRAESVIDERLAEYGFGKDDGDVDTEAVSRDLKEAADKVFAKHGISAKATVMTKDKFNKKTLEAMMDSDDSDDVNVDDLLRASIKKKKTVN